MTREEAISVLERVAHTESKWPGTEDTLEALDMAISALRRQDHFREVTKKMDPMTNADRIRAMTDEELAELLFQVGYDNGWGMKEYALEWLQQSAEEDDHDERKENEHV